MCTVMMGWQSWQNTTILNVRNACLCGPADIDERADRDPWAVSSMEAVEADIELMEAHPDVATRSEVSIMEHVLFSLRRDNHGADDKANMPQGPARAAPAPVAIMDAGAESVSEARRRRLPQMAQSLLCVKV